MRPSKRIESEELKKRKGSRRFLQWLSKIVFWVLTDLEIENPENFPDKGPLLVVGNHFSIVDTAAIVRTAPYPIEFIGGAVFANAPRIIALLPRLWGYLPVFRGTGSSFALKEAEKILNQEGVVVIFPEGGSHGRTLRPPRPGPAFLAARTGARVLPIGLINMDEVFASLAKFRRQKIIVRIGKPIGPFETTKKGRERRAELDEIGDQIMRTIAEMIPPEKHGYLSDDPKLRAEVEKYWWGESPEGEVDGTNVR